MNKKLSFSRVRRMAVIILLCAAAVFNMAVTALAADSSDNEYTLVVVTGSSVNIRSGPGTQYGKIDTVSAGTRYRWLADGTDSSGNTWYKIQYSASAGWISGQYSKKITYSTDNVQAYIDEIARSYGAVGVQAAIIRNGTVADTYNYGYAALNSTAMTSDTKIRVASLSKVIVAMEAMKLQENGIVDIDRNISSYWGASLPVAVTLKSMLTHTSTLSAGLSYNYTMSGTLNQLKARGNYTGGTVGSSSSWTYNNYAVGAAGSTLEIAMNGLLDDRARSDFFSPLGITASWYSGEIGSGNVASLYYSNHQASRTAAQSAGIKKAASVGCSTAYFAGGLTISAYDYAKLIAILANDGTYEGSRYLSEKSVETIEARRFTASEHGGSFSQCMPLRYKAGLYGQSELYYHTGNAYGVLALASYNPSTRNGVVVVTTGASETRDSQGVYAVCSAITEYLYGVCDSGAQGSTTATTASTSSTVSTNTTESTTTAATTAVTHNYAEQIVIAQENVRLNMGESTTLNALLTPGDADDEIVWSSSSPCVSVDKNGVVTAQAYGIAVVTASGGKSQGSCTVSVEPKLDFTMLGASIRLSDPYGIRFGIHLGKDSEYSACDIVEYGTLIIGSGSLGSAELTLETANARRIKADAIYSESDSELVYTGVLTNIPASAFGTSVTARGYLIYRDVDGLTHVVYTDTVSRSFSGVAAAAYENYSAINEPSASQREVLEKLKAILEIN